jgi:hypothetical protein
LEIGQGSPRHIIATLTVAAFRPWRGWACSDCAGLGQCFLRFPNNVACYNDQQQLKLHNDEEKGKRIFGKLAGKLLITRLLIEFEIF